ncbi:DUF6795 domain-containing protein [Halospina sp. K52047b]|uniref:DUF6795 domain-containing protein n=1 Tax=Halospina sp. K52047b TaxID=2614160 RepID=UPI00124A63D3|nr:DUF6795 domain-containing protein [Halospina sp. K52047b]KAA8981249.1 DUF4198 domain-containing protein [Halospina sp. K52047b]
MRADDGERRMTHRRTVASWCKLSLIPLLVAASYFLYSSEVMADMFGWFKRYDVHLSPEVRGQLKDKGKPLKGALITREVHYGKSYIDRTRTDSEGNFSFSPRSIRSSLPSRPLTEARVIQLIHAQVRGESYILWQAATEDIVTPKAFRKHLNRLSCDISNPDKTHHLHNHEHPQFDHNVGSICRWE